MTYATPLPLLAPTLVLAAGMLVLGVLNAVLVSSVIDVIELIRPAGL